MTIEHRTIMRRWADATRYLRWDEAEQLWRELMVEWLRPPGTDQGYWNDLLARRMAVLERKEQRNTVSDIEFDKAHGDINQ
jgi:hypothetical protein